MDKDILFHRENHLGIVTLNRPQALNALSLEMIDALQEQLLTWENDAHIAAVLVQANGEKAFCAGGDVRWLYQAGLEKDPRQLQFFQREYQLNYHIHCFKKPYIVLLNGLTMGGGVGISLHGSHPIATEHFSFAMPETGIGFFPDIGASYLLTRCPGFIGSYLALTGSKLNAEAAYSCKLVKALLPFHHLNAFVKELLHTDLSDQVHHRIDACVKKFSTSTLINPLHEQQKVIDSCFSLNTVEEIVAALEAHHDKWSQKTLEELKKKAPLSLKVTLAQMQKAKSLSLAECLELDLCLTKHFMKDADFYEGIRALLVDKDKNPRWKPSSLAEISLAKIANYFECHENHIKVS